jgi:hypothetical protein
VAGGRRFESVVKQLGRFPAEAPLLSGDSPGERLGTVVAQLAATPLPYRARPIDRAPCSPRPIEAAVRVLVTEAVLRPEARLQISAGPLAGSEIHLRLGHQGVEAVLLTLNETSRQTLSVAMQEVSSRLLRKGQLLKTLASESSETSGWVDSRGEAGYLRARRRRSSSQ